MSSKKTILITGGAGFIGSHVVRHFVNKYSDYHIINGDALTYAGNLKNLKDVENAENYTFVKLDIRDQKEVLQFFKKYTPTDIIHLAAESHVDRSIAAPMDFVMTNVVGTVNLLHASFNQWGENENNCFYHVSTDEVYGSLGDEGFFIETTAYDPKSPYSASKASSDHFVRAWAHTFGLNVKLSNCSNNYGPYQFPEKLIPLMINNIKVSKSLPVYGDGANVRDWLWVLDHVDAIDTIFHRGKSSETYNIGGKNEWKNIDLVYLLCDIMDSKLNRVQGTSRELITFVKDRAGHDKRYAIDPSKIEKDLDWFPSLTFEQGIDKTVDWYLNNEEWMSEIVSGNYTDYYEEQYLNR